ncbi:hypothetical protein F4808DRAFT_444943 [Astrocystis sublimbata]|nr:hypothetical protein F4808DRAFT_444943 [Astrocystis sublimbata]
MPSNAMRWLGRCRRPSPTFRAFISISRPHDDKIVLFRRLHISQTLSRSYSGSRAQDETTPSSSPSKPSTLDKVQDGPSQGPRWALIALIFAGSAGATYLYRRQSVFVDDDVINTTTFSAFTITQREEVSPTAFIITLRPSSWVDHEELDSAQAEGEPIGFLSTRVQQAWRHGLWSVEIKQPQLQIARHYTPLPPLTKPPEPLGESYDEQEEQSNLRLLIRKMEGGEMSNYLSRQRVGDVVWLRGPHLGFDIPRRLGDRSYDNTRSEAHNASDERGVVFLAGGTGIAPALQIAHKLLDHCNSDKIEGSRPHISILWANRWGIDALGREQTLSTSSESNNWFRFWGTKGSSSDTSTHDKRNETNREPASSLALQIRDLKRRYPSHFDVSYFVDAEGTFIKAKNVETALASTIRARIPSAAPASKIDVKCTWHSAKAVETLPDDNDAERSSSSEPACACTCKLNAGAATSKACAGVNLVCVSGPDGFIEAYSGGKRWHNGSEMQGAIRGVLGRMQQDRAIGSDEWLMLKL